MRSRSPSPIRCSPSRGRSRSRSRSRSNSPCTIMAKVRSPSPNRSKMSSVARKAALLSRFSDAYSQARLDAQCLLRRCIDRAETVQRIIYIATVVNATSAVGLRVFGAMGDPSLNERCNLKRLVHPEVTGERGFQSTLPSPPILSLTIFGSYSFFYNCELSNILLALKLSRHLLQCPSLNTGLSQMGSRQIDQ